MKEYKGYIIKKQIENNGKAYFAVYDKVGGWWGFASDMDGAKIIVNQITK